MLKSNKESSKKYDPLPMLAYMVYEDFELSELVPISMLNTTPNNITHAHMLKNISSSSNFEIITQKVLLKEIVLKTPHELIWKSKFPLILYVQTFNLGNT